MKSNYYISYLIILLIFFFNIYIQAKDISAKSGLKSIQKTSALDPLSTLSNINNWSYWLSYDGKSAYNPNTGGSGGVYPRGTAGAIYMDGCVWGAQVNGNIRVGGQTYRVGTQALLNHIYRIRKDWADLTTANVREETAEFFNTDILLVTDEQATDIIDQYKNDWKNWPVGQGAPYVDVDDNGVYNPVLDGNGMPDASQGDYPGLENADQVIWFKVNDQDANKTQNLYGSDPIGVEMQVTVWGYSQRDSRLGQAIYKKYKITNISADTLEEMYLAQWSDPDLGNYGDDLAGCDSLLDCAFVYNGKATDSEYDKYSLIPPACAYALLQGPIVPSPGDSAFFNGEKVADYKNLSMKSFGYFGSGTEWMDPPMGIYDGTLQWYNLLRGNAPTTDIDNPTMFKHATGPNEGEDTKFPLNGDPVTGQGDVDDSPGDRRILMTSGPFNLEPGDSQEMVVSVTGGHGNDYLNSVSELKTNIEYIRGLYGKPFKVARVSYHTKQPNNFSTELYIEADLTDYDNVDSCVIGFKPQYGSESSFTVTLYDDGQHNDQQAGDNIWGNNISIENRKYPYSADLSLHLDSGDEVHTNYLTNVRLRPLPTLENWEIIWENRKQDSKINNDETVHLQFDICNNDSLNHINTLSITRDEKFEFNNGIVPGGIIEVDSYIFVVTGSATDDSVTFGYWIYFDHHSEFIRTTFPVIYWEGNVGVIDVSHNGEADASISVSIVEPDSLTGDEYKVYFDQQHYYLGDDGEWHKINYLDSVGKGLAKQGDLTGTTLSAIAYTSPNAGTRDLRFILDLVAVDYDYSDGVLLTFPPEIVINSAEYTDGNAHSTYHPIIDNNTVLWGGPDTTGDGGISGGEVFTVNINTPTLPLDVDYVVFDDGWAVGYGAPYDTLGDGIVHAVGACTITKEGYAFKTENHWNLSDLTKDEIVLEDQTVIDGVDIYTGEIKGDPIVDGFLITVKGSYEVPKTFTDVILIKVNGAEYSIAGEISDYYRHCWAEDARSVSTRGFGSVDLGEMGQDYECRCTGVYKSTPTVISGINVWEVESGGSMASLYGARIDDLANHPLNPNPGVSEPFLVRIPFEVWNRDTGEQINFSIYDRKQVYDGTMDIYAFNPYDRMYTEFVNTPYDPVNVIPEDGGTHADHFTWNLVWWGDVTFENGDVVVVKYVSPITLNDYFIFTAEPSTVIKNNNVISEFRLSQNYPNPFNPVTTISYQLQAFSDVELNIYNMLGQKVRTLVKKKQAAGSYNIQFDASGLASGVYVYRIKAGSFVSSKKMLLIK